MKSGKVWLRTVCFFRGHKSSIVLDNATKCTKRVCTRCGRVVWEVLWGFPLS